MKQIIHWIKTYRITKTLFVIAVSIIVVAQLLSIGKTISFEQLKQIFDEIPLWVIDDGYRFSFRYSMLNYDLTLNRILNLKVSNRNSLNLAGLSIQSIILVDSVVWSAWDFVLNFMEIKQRKRKFYLR